MLRITLPAADVSRLVEAVLTHSPRARKEKLRDHDPAWRIVCAMDAGMIHHDALTPTAWPQVRKLAGAFGVDLVEHDQGAAAAQ